MGINAAECTLVLFLDCLLQVIDSFRRQNANHKWVRIIKAENLAGERDFGGHVRVQFHESRRSGTSRECKEDPKSRDHNRLWLRVTAALENPAYIQPRLADSRVFAPTSWQTSSALQNLAAIGP